MKQQPLQILLIGTNRHGLVARSSVLEDLGYVVETAKNARSGLEKFGRKPFALVVTDYRMPHISGLEILQRIRKKNRLVPVVILSGHAEKLGLTQKSTGADAVLAKGPTETRDLIRTVTRLLRKKPRPAIATERSRRLSTGTSQDVK